MTLVYFFGYNQIMSWWVMITTKGRLLQDFCVSFSEGEIRISWVRFEEGEQLAILIDRLHNNARIYVPFDEAQGLAARHQYELYIPRVEGEPFINSIERFLSVFELSSEARVSDRASDK